MQVTKTSNSPTNVSLQINAEEADLAPIKRHVLSHFTRSVKVPGFRAGKAPAELLEKHVNQNQLGDEFMEHALNDLFRRAIEHEKLRPVGQPEVNVKKFVPYSQLEFEAKFDVIGQVSLPNYKSIKQAKKKVEVSVKEVNDVIENLRTRGAERKEANRPAKQGDEVTIDFEGQDDKGLVPGAAGKEYPLILGSNSFIPGFEENLIGMKTGEQKEFDIKFPKDYGVASLQSKKVKFKLSVSKVSELITPKADDELAKKVGPFKSLAELKADVKKQLHSEKQLQADREYENELINKITSRSEVNVPESMVEEQLLVMEEDEKRNLAYRGTTWQEHLDQEGINEQQHRDRHRPDALQRVKAGLVLSEVSQIEGIDVTPQELEIRRQILKGQYQDPAMQEEVDKPENRRDITARLLTEKTINKLVEYASKKS